MSGQPWLIVVSGRQGTGKTTLSRGLASRLRAAIIRVDAIETAILRSGTGSRPLGPVGYDVAHELAAANLAVGTHVVIDAVNPVAEARAGWHSLRAVSQYVMFETKLTDTAEHRRRVELRQPDLAQQVVPTWRDVLDHDYLPWDEGRDGARFEIDTFSADAALAAALDHLDADAARDAPRR